ncbi:hypothetical protein ACIBM3_31040 [Rhodococcus erythropolis]|uniref:hypothetical protein n=1 Tax=Rhodococcus erythropolis TaxID=1833 RepID=UPI0037BCDE1A
MAPKDQASDDPPASQGKGEIEIWSFTDEDGFREALVVNYEEGSSESSSSGVMRGPDLETVVFAGAPDGKSLDDISEELETSGIKEYIRVIRRDFCTGEPNEVEDL